jgi:hypothetical protein
MGRPEWEPLGPARPLHEPSREHGQELLVPREQEGGTRTHQEQASRDSPSCFSRRSSRFDPNVTGQLGQFFLPAIPTLFGVANVLSSSCRLQQLQSTWPIPPDAAANLRTLPSLRVATPQCGVYHNQPSLLGLRSWLPRRVTPCWSRAAISSRTVRTSSTLATTAHRNAVDLAP